MYAGILSGIILKIIENYPEMLLEVPPEVPQKFFQGLLMIYSDLTPEILSEVFPVMFQEFRLAILAKISPKSIPRSTQVTNEYRQLRFLDGHESFSTYSAFVL